MSEVYDADPLAASRLINISTRGLAQAGNNVLIAGCSLAGASGSNEVVIQALAPSLVPLGVNNALPDPVVTLYDSNANAITANDNWKARNRLQLKTLASSRRTISTQPS